MSLKELTKEKHQDAERTEFAKLLLSGKISKEMYGLYLAQMLEVYGKLEYYCVKAELLKDLPGLGRALYIFENLKELDIHHLLMAHLYVRHMGDLYGGQMIAKKVPGSGKFYQFRNKEELIGKIRAKLTDDLGDEANIAFDHAIAIMKELNESSLEHAD